jgi:hypothetical protein
MGACAPLLSQAVFFPTKAVVGASAVVALAVWLQQQVDQTVFTPESHSLDGQAFRITDGTTGLGMETAKRLAVGGPAHIILTARTASKGEAALLEIRSYLHEKEIDTTKLNLEYKVLDLDKLEGSTFDQLPRQQCRNHGSTESRVDCRWDGTPNASQSFGPLCLDSSTGAILGKGRADSLRFFAGPQDCHQWARFGLRLDRRTQLLGLEVLRPIKVDQHVV